MRNLLLVTRNFPPTSHVSVERVTKLAKYLPDFGWRPTVLTGERGTYGLPEDSRSLEEVAGVDVIRTPAPEFSLFYRERPGRGDGAPIRSMARRSAWHPKSWLVPDSQLLWYPFATWSALRRARSAGWSAVLASSFPPTAIMIAHTVSERLRVPYIADFRDSWTGYHSAPRRPLPLAALERRLEAALLRDAAAVVSVDPGLVQPALDRLPPQTRPSLTVIPNGYDEADFQGLEPAELPRFSVVHTGQMRRAPGLLWDALSRAVELRPELRGRLHLWQVGFVDARAGQALAAPPDGVMVHLIPPVPQREAIAYMLGADLLLVEEFQSIMPSKTLQYLRAGRPILGVLDGGGLLRDVLQPVPQAVLVHPDEAGRAGDMIAEMATRPRAPSIEPSRSVTAYSRHEIARRFAAVLDEAVRVD